MREPPVRIARSCNPTAGVSTFPWRAGGFVEHYFYPPRRPRVKGSAMPHHFGVLLPSTNTTAEFEYSRLLPPEWQAHYARLSTRSAKQISFSPARGEHL